MKIQQFIHLVEPDSDYEVIVNTQNISYVQRLSGSTIIQFVGNTESLHLRGNLAQSIWEHIAAHGTTIYSPSADNKNAEPLLTKTPATPSDKDSGNPF